MLNKKKIMLYVHIPFCERKCNYCDFLSFYANDNICEKYIKKLLQEIEYKKYLADDYIITSIYIGGGTPSFIDSKYIEMIIRIIKNFYNISSNCEISIEVNPHSAIKYKLKTYFNIGINRLSFGLQSANENELKILGRLHTFSNFMTTYNDAIDCGFTNINVDIMNGIPTQTINSYNYTLNKILTLNIKHISIYNLIIEPNTIFYKLYNSNKLKLPNEDDIIKMDNITLKLTEYYNFHRYEISNYSKNNFECKHNLGYWSDVPYIGFGLNSSSYIENKRFKNISNFKKYLAINYKNIVNDINQNNYYDEILLLTKNDLISEYIMLGMRKIEGINKKHFYKKFNIDFYNRYKEILDKYISFDCIAKNETNFYFTKKGFDISNTILSEMI